MPSMASRAIQCHEIRHNLLENGGFWGLVLSKKTILLSFIPQRVLLHDLGVELAIKVRS